ncbi:MAG: hypothetical protein WCK42_06825 [Myxococcaceae bacterium]
MFIKIALLSGVFAFSAFAEDTLEERVEKLEDKVNAPQLRANLFNPGLTVFGNSVVCVGKGCERPFTLREIELDLRASIDPWADGVVILAFEPHGGDHAAVAIEEGYVVIKKLPLIDDAPWGLSLKIGHYLAPFGRFNQIHLHDLPQINQPAAMSAFLGGPSGLNRNGISAEFFVPTPGDNNSLRLNLNLMNGGGLPFQKVKDAQYPSGLIHSAWFWDLAPEHDLEVGLSAYLEHNPTPGTQLIQLYGTDINYKWRPYKQGDKRTFLLGGELFVANGTQGLNGYWPLGGFVWTQYQLNQWFYPSVRYSYYQGVKYDYPSHSVGAFLTYYTTEFLRLRAGYEWDNHNQNQVLLEVNFVMGSHPVEPYWVNR